MSSSQNSAAIAARLQTVSTGLQFSSEADYPFEVFIWQGEATAPLTTQKLLERTGHPQNTTVEQVGLDVFFQPTLQLQDWYGASEKATVDQFKLLVNTLKTDLQAVQVYRVGTLEVDVYIVGQADATDLVGLSTKVVET